MILDIPAGMQRPERAGQVHNTVKGGDVRLVRDDLTGLTGQVSKPTSVIYLIKEDSLR